MRLDHTFWLTSSHSEKAGRGGASSGVITSLVEAVGHEAFTKTQRAKGLQFSLEVGVLVSRSYKY